MIMERWPAKDPGEVLDYTWAVPLDTADTISTLVSSVTAGTVVIDDDAHASGVAQITVSGGVDGEDAELLVVITTTGGDTFRQRFLLPVRASTEWEPVSVSEFRAHLRDVPDYDHDLLPFITAAREYFEEATGRTLKERTFTEVMDCWPGEGEGGGDLGWWQGVRQGAMTQGFARFIEMPHSPVQSITSVKTLDNAGAETTFSSAGYVLDTASTPARLGLKDGYAWPVPGRSFAGIRIAYTAGYASAAQVPAPFRQAVLQLAAHWYENRELVDQNGPQKVPMQAMRIASKYRVMRL